MEFYALEDVGVSAVVYAYGWFGDEGKGGLGVWAVSFDDAIAYIFSERKTVGGCGICGCWARSHCVVRRIEFLVGQECSRANCAVVDFTYGSC